MTEVTPEASEEFARKVRELLEVITGKPYAIEEKQNLEGRVWVVYFDEDKVKGMDKISMNHGAQWVEEDKDGTIQVYSWHFYDVNDVASEEYGIHFRDEDVLQERENWEKYRKKVPGLIAELEAAKRIANEANKKYGTSIRLWSGEKPYLKTSFDAKGMGNDEKLHEIERRARAMLEAWRLFDEWETNVGREIYMKTTKRRLDKIELMDEVISTLHGITKGWYGYGLRKPGVRWVVVGSDTSERDLAANRGAWRVEETKEGIVITSDNLEIVNAQSLREYRLIKRREDGEVAIGEAKEGFMDTVISPELMRKVVDQVGQESGVKIRVMDDKPLMVAEFKTAGLKSYGKLYEIERHAKALAEAWKRIGELAHGKR